jgi:polysaccharide biosynthesis transport protein
MGLRDYVHVLRRRRILIAATTCAVLLGAILVSLVQKPQYQARARVLVEAQQSLFGGAVPPVGAALVLSEMQVLQSEPVADLVARKLGRVPRISASTTGAVIDVIAEGPDPVQVATAANTYVEVYIDYRRTQAIDDLTRASQELQSKVASLQKEIDAVSAQLRDTPACTGTPPPPTCTLREPLQQDRDALLNQIIPLKQKLTQLELEGSAGTGGLRFITRASAPTTPVSPRPVRNALMGVFAGVLLGTAIAFLLDHLDDSIKRKEDVERATRNLPVLGLIPAVSGWKNKVEPQIVSRTDAGSPAAEAYRALRTSITFLSIDKAIRTIQITSASASEGKTTTTANLAIAMARMGQRVVVVSCDLRRPRIHSFFGLSNTVGFTSVLLGEATLAEATQRVPGVDRLLVVASGPPPPNPSELLASRRTKEVLAALASKADVVLIDCPPVLPVTDAATLVPLVDATLLVATAGATIGKDLSRALELLRQVDAPVVGTVLNGIRAEGAYGYVEAYSEGSDPASTNGNGSGSLGRSSRRSTRKQDDASPN